MMINISIQKASLLDVDILQQISKQTFFETFDEMNTEENMAKFLEEAFSIEKLTDELNNSNSEFYFVVNNNLVIGYLKINFGHAKTEIKKDDSVEIERIYVLKNYLGKKIGHALFKKALQVATTKNAKYIWLGVWEENKRAISFYKKHGLEEFDQHIFKLGDDEQTDIMMKLAVVY